MPAAAPAIHGSLRTRVYAQLREKILCGVYTRGMALTEIRISQELGVSRTPVREAFSQLELDGLVKATPNKGVVVEGLDQNDLLDWYDIRIRMEGMAAEKATLHMTPEITAELQQTIDEARIMVTNGQIESLLQLDARFHDLIFKASGSRVLLNFLNPIANYTRQSRQISLANPLRAEEVVKEHTLILTAMQAGDQLAARQQMEIHISHAADSYRRVIKSSN